METDRTPRVEVKHVRDPDGSCQIAVYIDGQPAPITVYDVDAGAGWDEQSWQAHRDDCLAQASAGMQEDLRAAFDDPPGGDYYIATAQQRRA